MQKYNHISQKMQVAAKIQSMNRIEMKQMHHEMGGLFKRKSAVRLPFCDYPVSVVRVRQSKKSGSLI
jgi:hypothetical protein